MGDYLLKMEEVRRDEKEKDEEYQDKTLILYERLASE